MRVRLPLSCLSALCVLFAVATSAVPARVLLAGDLDVEPFRREHMHHHWNVDAAYPVTGNAEIDRQLKEWLGAAINESVEDAKIMIDEELPDGRWEMWVDYSVSQPSDAAVSVVFDAFTYAQGAAHPNGTVSVLNFWRSTGKRILLSDMFREPDTALGIIAREAKRLVAEELRKNNPDEFPDQESMESLIWFDDGFRQSEEHCLELTPEGVRVIFQQYRILPYAFGMPSAVFSLDMLADAGPNPDIWPLNK